LLPNINVTNYYVVLFSGHVEQGSELVIFTSCRIFVVLSLAV